ncbi:MAG: hypothetical protein IPL51_13555 [Candidatus Competibacteraceae bacterium]|nr:hypothetical protein [Candidatus Competibacteraceae bacterium]
MIALAPTSASKLTNCDDNIDLALCVTKTTSRDAIARKRVTLKRVICAAPSYLAARGEPKTPQDLTSHACFSYLLADQNIWRLADNQGREISIRVRHRF